MCTANSVDNRTYLAALPENEKRSLCVPFCCCFFVSLLFSGSHVYEINFRLGIYFLPMILFFLLLLLLFLLPLFRCSLHRFTSVLHVCAVPFLFHKLLLRFVHEKSLQILHPFPTCFPYFSFTYTQTVFHFIFIVRRFPEFGSSFPLLRSLSFVLSPFILILISFHCDSCERVLSQ